MMTRTHMCVLGGLAGIAAIGVTGAAATPSQTSGFVIRETTRTVLVLRLLRPQITLATARGHAVLLPLRIRP